MKKFSEPSVFVARGSRWIDPNLQRRRFQFRNTSIHLSAWGVVGQSTWTTYPWVDTVVNVPEIASGAGDCGNSDKCPLVATIEVDLIVRMISTIAGRFSAS